MTEPTIIAIIAAMVAVGMTGYTIGSRFSKNISADVVELKAQTTLLAQQLLNLNNLLTGEIGSLKGQIGELKGFMSAQRKKP